MKLTILVATAAAAALTLTSCTTPKCPDCQTLPSSGTYGVCAAEGPGAEHVRVGDKVLIGQIGNVTRVAFGPPTDPTKTRLQMFQGTRGLVGWLPRGAAHEDHVVVIGTLNLPRADGACKAGTLISVEFMKPDSDGKYRGASSGPHYGHIHAQIESLKVPTL